MNAVTPTPSQSATPLSAEVACRLSVSALVDGELSATELDALLQDKADPAGWDTDWKAFHLIGDVLRGSEPVVPSRLPPDFAATVMRRLAGAGRSGGASAWSAGQRCRVPLEAGGRAGVPGCSGGCRMGTGWHGGTFVWRRSAAGSGESSCHTRCFARSTAGRGGADATGAGVARRPSGAAAGRAPPIRRDVRAADASRFPAQRHL